MSARPKLENAPQPPPLLDLSKLLACLRELRAQPTRRDAYRPDIVAGSLVLQAGELRSAHHHGADSDALGLRVAELLCDLVEFADVANIDTERSVDRYVCHCEERVADRPRVKVGRLARSAAA